SSSSLTGSILTGTPLLWLNFPISPKGRLSSSGKGNRKPETGIRFCIFFRGSVTRNDDCVHEKFGWFQNIHVKEKGGAIAGSDIDLRIFLPHWAFVFALEEEKKAGFKKSIQVFDKHGVSITKIFVVERTH